MSTTTAAAPCLKPVLAGLFRAKAGQVCLTITDEHGNTDFDAQHCKVKDISVQPSVQIPNDSITAKKWCFTLSAHKNYSVQLVCSQTPAIGSTADLGACGVKLMSIDATNEIQTWTVLT